MVQLNCYKLFFLTLLVGFYAIWPGTSGAAAPHVTTRLLCEYRGEPLGIDDPNPRLSWIMESEQRGKRQKAYRILVATTKGKLKIGQADLWDSGKVQSDRSIQIEYQGKPLLSAMDCFWKVMTWDQNGISSAWSTPAKWTMGLLAKEDWQSHWISFDTAAENEDRELHLPPPPLLRKVFRPSGKITKATLYASALGLFEVSINGERVGKDFFVPGWTNYNKRVFYLTYDVTRQLQAGENVLAAVLASGWYAGYVGFIPPHLQPRKSHSVYGDKPALLLQLELVYDDGRKEVVGTDSTWKGATGPTRSADIQMGERYDAQLERSGWDRAGYDDSSWKGVDVVAVGTDVEIGAYPGSPVREQQRLSPVTITERRKNVLVYDFGQNFAGRVRLKVKGLQGSVIKLRFAEMLHEDGSIMTENLRTARATDTYILKGGGTTEEWEPAFTYHGFRYVEMTCSEGISEPVDLTATVLHSSAPIAGKFNSSEPLVNKLYENILWTQRSNFFDIPTDCPQRDERLGWTGDAQIFIKSALYNMQLGPFFKKWLMSLFDDQRPSGALPDFAPLPFLFFEPSPGWMDAGIICPYALYRAYGDTDSIRRYFGAMKRFMDYLEENSAGLLRNPQGNNWGDWQSIDSHTPAEVIATAYFAYDARLMSEMAMAIAKTEDARYYRQLSENIKKAFEEAFVDQNGRIRGDSQTAYAMAIDMDLLSEKMRAKAAGRLIELIKNRDYHLSTGFLGIKHLLPALSAMDASDIAMKLLLQKTYPSWGYPIMNGATTVWERWNSYTYADGFANPGMNSFNHYAFGSVLEWLFASLAGIDAAAPGYKEILVSPQVSHSIRQVSAAYESMYGRIESSWQIEADNFFSLQLRIPANTSALVRLPADGVRLIREGGKPLSKVRGIHIKSVEESAVVLQVPSGLYSFRTKISR
ncbi:MAG: family 78 glycoside hydrolase catalytic domain [Pseudomonadota bacterium]